MEPMSSGGRSEHGAAFRMGVINSACAVAPASARKHGLLAEGFRCTHNAAAGARG